MTSPKLKALSVVALVLQIAALLLVLVNVPEPGAAMRIGLEQLQTNAPTEAATSSKTAEGNWVIRTAGDYFRMADSWFGFILAVALGSMIMNILIFILLLYFLREKRKASSQVGQLERLAESAKLLP